MTILKQIELVPHDPAWAQMARDEADRIRMVLGPLMIGWQHIGSTAIPGIKAKPILDVMPLVSDINAVAAFRSGMEAVGYTWYGEYGLPGRRYFNRDHLETAVRIANVHIYAANDLDVTRHLAFRDYLRANQEIALKYEALKVHCAGLFPNDVGDYNDCKNGWIKAIEAEAICCPGQRALSGLRPV